MPKLQPKSPNKVKCKIPLMTFNAEIEMEICMFYEKILQEMYKNYGQNFSKLRSSLKNIRSYKNPDLQEHETVSFENEYDRLAFIFAYGVIHSSVMYDHFLNMLKLNKSMMEKIITMKEIKLCILGGGPAFEAVSLCKLFNSILEGCKKVGSPSLQVYVTLVDKCIEWEQDAEVILNSAQNNLCRRNRLQVHFSFLQADLASEFTEDVREALKSSHFIIMFHCLTDADYASYSRPGFPDIMQQTIESMRYKACLFFLHTSGGGFFKKMDKMINGLPHTARIYGPNLYDRYLLDIDSEQALSDALGHTFSFLKCTSRSTFSCSAWVKTRNVVNIKNLHPEAEKIQDDAPEERKLKEKSRKNKVKKTLQFPAKFRELYCSSSDDELEL